MRSSGASSNSNGKKINSVQKFSSESDGQICSPKRKLSNLSDMLTVGASPGKKTKTKKERKKEEKKSKYHKAGMGYWSEQSWGRQWIDAD